jgi:hypothetical protein
MSSVPSVRQLSLLPLSVGEDSLGCKEKHKHSSCFFGDVAEGHDSECTAAQARTRLYATGQTRPPNFSHKTSKSQADRIENEGKKTQENSALGKAGPNGR